MIKLVVNQLLQCNTNLLVLVLNNNINSGLCTMLIKCPHVYCALLVGSIMITGMLLHDYEQCNYGIYMFEMCIYTLIQVSLYIF